MSKPFDLLRELSRFGEGTDINLNDAAIRPAFGLHVEQAIDRALKDPILLQGQRAEAMFEALVVSLGEVQLIKPEDGGRVFASEKMQPPDFRVVLQDGTNWLVEVKNVYKRNAFRQRRRLLTRDYRKSLDRYAAATGGTLKLAIFWARWSIWTLVDPEKLAPGGGDLTLDMMEALKVSELASLGDESLGMRAPLLLRLTMDSERTSPIAPDGTVHLTIGQAQMFSGAFEVSDRSDQQIAWTVMQYSDWETEEPRAVVDGDRLIALEFDCAPPELSHQGFETAGFLSRMFARYYADRTIENGEVVRIAAPAQPEWFGALRQKDGDGRMPLWRFTLEPNYEGQLIRG
ncbi:hypothetical protein EOD29_23790 [Mesorhizobium sp. M1A.T.Ca.IN.004.03.1.1]|uniref:hypothetical protein n=1 Tax=Mesorhizobium sp. M1A.T.Ca.IN.004.03.1.1 TaxID=2496795 RepID=UPI000FCAC709|nr:hypothetical protein [Mesorhizobium sp. M1A.T.Ca.IN.004.03.1.1]RUV41180.1 hypothetical protein EOD29_23790 [Mesorhizobium sp. M1A.T.Ca.IN.004.03.1.1]